MLPPNVADEDADTAGVACDRLDTARFGNAVILTSVLPASVFVPVVNVRVVRVGVQQFLMTVRMAVWFSLRVRR